MQHNFLSDIPCIRILSALQSFRRLGFGFHQSSDPTFAKLFGIFRDKGRAKFVFSFAIEIKSRVLTASQAQSIHDPKHKANALIVFTNFLHYHYSI